MGENSIWIVVLSSGAVAAVISAVAGSLNQRSRARFERDVQSTVRLEVESQLAVRRADVEYELEARKRLYSALGPLRFQLLMASRELAGRVSQHPGIPWNMTTNGYYVRSFVYRILRPVAVGTLVERQMNFADFSVDPSGNQLLRFLEAASGMLTSSDPVEPLPKHRLDWSRQAEHLFSGSLRSASNSLIVSEDGTSRCRWFPEFEEAMPDLLVDAAIAPLAAIFNRCEHSLLELPVFWVRVVGLGHVCCWLLRELGPRIGLRVPDYDTQRLLEAVDDDDIRKLAPDFVHRFDEMIERVV